MDNMVDKFRALASKAREKKSMFRYARSDIVTILAGPERTPFKIHKDVLCDQSEYFAANFGETWNKDKKAEASVPEIDAEIFEMIFSWLYAAEIPVCLGDEQSEQLQQPRWSVLLRLYRAADFLLMFELMNKIMDKALLKHQDMVHCNWTVNGLSWFLSHDIVDLPQFYKLVIDSAASWMAKNQPVEEELRSTLARIQAQHPQAIIDIIVRLNTYHATAKNVALQNWCTYHVHPDGQKCESWTKSSGDNRGSRHANWPL